MKFYDSLHDYYYSHQRSQPTEFFLYQDLLIWSWADIKNGTGSTNFFSSYGIMEDGEKRFDKMVMSWIICIKGKFSIQWKAIIAYYFDLRTLCTYPYMNHHTHINTV